MTIRHLKIFIAVYKYQNVTKAAESLFMTQPTVTRAIQEIEEHYGVKFFERINHRLYINEIGHQFYFHAVHIIDSIDNMENEITDWDESGVIRVGATSTIASVVLPPILHEFETAYPKTRVKLVVANGSQLQSQLVHNELDFALIENGTTLEHLSKEVFFKDRLVLVLPPDDALLNEPNLTLDKLANAKFLLRENASMVRSSIDKIFAKHDIQITPAMESNSTHAIVQAVHYGLGISILPENLVAYSIKSGFVSSKKIDDESFIRKNYIVWHENKFLTKMSKKLIEAIKTSVKELNLM